MGPRRRPRPTVYGCSGPHHHARTALSRLRQDQAGGVQQPRGQTRHRPGDVQPTQTLPQRRQTTDEEPPLARAARRQGQSRREADVSQGCHLGGTRGCLEAHYRERAAPCGRQKALLRRQVEDPRGHRQAVRNRHRIPVLLADATTRVSEAAGGAGEEPLADVYYDPRGKMYEPHTGKAMDLGTRDVESYEFPSYTFNKLLFVEKRGQVPLLQAARIAERYDMALVTEAGFATVAARTLLSAGAKDKKYQVFCLHDADYPGYNILRTLREATERMPEHSMEVHDIGLTVEQVIAMGKTPETYTRSSTVPKDLIPLLNDVEQEWFVGEYLGKRGKKDTYGSKRFELDDLTAPEVIQHIEDRLEELEVEPKVIPPDEALAEERGEMYRAKVALWVDEIVAELL